MIRKWLSIAVLVTAAAALLNVLSCGDPQELVSISITPGTETIGNSNIPVAADAGIQVQLQATGSYIHPPVTKNITDQVTWLSTTPQMFTVNSTGLMTTTGNLCGGTVITASVTTNSDGSGVSSSGASVTGYMTANVVCYTGGGGGGGGEPTLTINFSGSGIGTVTVAPTAFTCASTDVSCVTSSPTNTTLTLTATPVAPSTFGGWAGSGCTGTAGCTILLQSDTIITAAFN
jgi:hypothetical protein